MLWRRNLGLCGTKSCKNQRLRTLTWLLPRHTSSYNDIDDVHTNIDCGYTVSWETWLNWMDLQNNGSNLFNLRQSDSHSSLRTCSTGLSQCRATTAAEAGWPEQAVWKLAMVEKRWETRLYFRSMQTIITPYNPTILLYKSIVLQVHLRNIFVFQGVFTLLFLCTTCHMHLAHLRSCPSAPCGQGPHKSGCLVSLMDTQL